MHKMPNFIFFKTLCHYILPVYLNVLRWCIKYYDQDLVCKIHSLLLTYRERASVFWVHYKVTHPWEGWNTEWHGASCSQVGHRNRKLRARLEPVSWFERGSGADGTPHLRPLFASHVAAVCAVGAITHCSHSGRHRQDWCLLHQLVTLATQRCPLGSAGVPEFFSCHRFSWQGKTQARPLHLKLNVRRWLGGKRTSYRLCLIGYTWYVSHGWTINKPFHSPLSHCY